MIKEGRFRRNPALAGSGSSALECGRLKLWVIGLLRNEILFTGLEPRSWAMKGFRPAFAEAATRRQV
jgi:hypothetical protein